MDYRASQLDLIGASSGSMLLLRRERPATPRGAAESRQPTAFLQSNASVGGPAARQGPGEPDECRTRGPGRME